MRTQEFKPCALCQKPLPRTSHSKLQWEVLRTHAGCRREYERLTFIRNEKPRRFFTRNFIALKGVEYVE